MQEIAGKCCIRQYKKHPRPHGRGFCGSHKGKSLPVVKLNTTNGSTSFLVDSGAEVSIIKLNKLNDDKKLIKGKILITGLGKVSIQTFGVCQETVIFDDSELTHEFQEVSEEFPIEMDGIIGYDFLRKHKIIFDFSNNCLTKIVSEDTNKKTEK